MATTSAWAVGSFVVGDEVDAGGDDLAVAHNHRAERAAATGEDVLGGQLDGLLHKGWISRHWSRIL